MKKLILNNVDTSCDKIKKTDPYDSCLAELLERLVISGGARPNRRRYKAIVNNKNKTSSSPTNDTRALHSGSVEYVFR